MGDRLARPIFGGATPPDPPPPDPPPPPPPPPVIAEPHLVGTPSGAVPGSYWVEATEWHYIASGGAEYASTGTAVATGATPGAYGVDGEDWAYGDASGLKRVLAKTSLGAKAAAAITGAYWVEPTASAGQQWQWVSGTTRYKHWNGI